MEKNKLQQLESMGECYTVDPKVAQNAIEKIERDKVRLAQKKQRSKFTIKKLIPVLTSVILTVAIGIAVYFSTIPEIIYYDSASVEQVRTYDLESDLLLENANVLHFSNSTTDTLAKIKESGKLGYVVQEITAEDNFMTNGTFDKILFYAVLLVNTDFDIEEGYAVCTNKHNVRNIVIKSTLSTKEENGLEKTLIKAKFVYKKHEYFISIEAFGDADPVEKLDFYLGILLGA